MYQSVLHIIRKLRTEGKAIGLLDKAAALAFFALLSAIPFLATVFFAATIFISPDTFLALIEQTFAPLLSTEGILVVEELATTISLSQTNIIGFAISAFFLLLASVKFASVLGRFIDTIWAPDMHARPAVRQKGMALLLVAVFIVLLITLLVVSTALYSLGIEGTLFGIAWAHILSASVTFLLFYLTAFFTFTVLPRYNIPLQERAMSSLLTTLIFGIGQLILYTYFSTVDIASSYGVFATLIVVLLWVYYSALLFLGGATLAKVLAKNTSAADA